MPFQKFILRRMQTGPAFWNIFSGVGVTHPLSDQILGHSVHSETYFLQKNSTVYNRSSHIQMFVVMVSIIESILLPQYVDLFAPRFTHMFKLWVTQLLSSHKCLSFVNQL
jgi:hypothetical protein